MIECKAPQIEVEQAVSAVDQKSERRLYPEALHLQPDGVGSE
ncbi:MAG: hypothetical protein R3E74_11080 [Pseudomonadales bacterium]